MTAATDKAQFYLEQLVPELHELEKKGVFSKDEIRQIVRRRRDFEHKLNGQGCVPVDCTRYIEYEMNLNQMRLLRAKRVGAKVSKHSGPRRLFPLLQRITKKFPGDLGLWMRYIDYARKQKAHKRVRTAFADVLRLHPQKAELWVYAARYEFDEQGDLNEAEGHMQRGIRISPKSQLLYREFFRLMLDSLLKIEVKRGNLGLNKPANKRSITGTDHEGDSEGVGEGNDNQIMLLDAGDDPFEADGQKQEVDPKMLEALEMTRGPHEQIARAIFDNAMKQLKGPDGMELAHEMFDLVAEYEIPGRTPLLQHIYAFMREQGIGKATTRDVALRMPLVGIIVNTADFAVSLGPVLTELFKSLSEDSPEARRLHFLSSRWVYRYLKTKDIDVNIAAALRATFLRILSSYTKLVENPESDAWAEGLPKPHQEAIELLDWASRISGSPQAESLREAAARRWPKRFETAAKRDPS